MDAPSSILQFSSDLTDLTSSTTIYKSNVLIDSSSDELLPAEEEEEGKGKEDASFHFKTILYTKKPEFQLKIKRILSEFYALCGLIELIISLSIYLVLYGIYFIICKCLTAIPFLGYYFKNNMIETNLELIPDDNNNVEVFNEEEPLEPFEYQIWNDVHRRQRNLSRRRG